MPSAEQMRDKLVTKRPVNKHVLYIQRTNVRSSGLQRNFLNSEVTFYLQHVTKLNIYHISFSLSL